MAYLRPCGNVFISDTWHGHKNRPRPSSEPGVDYAVGVGTNVVAPAAGVVIGIKDSASGASGRAMMIRTGNDWHRALHLSKIVVRSGGFVKGQVIAKSGASANGSESGVGAHLHWTFWHNRQVAPMPGSTPTQDFEAFRNSPAAVGIVGGLNLDEEDEMFTDADRKLLREVLRQVNNTHAGVWRGGSVTINKKVQQFKSGIISLVADNKALIAKQAGEIEALKAIVEQLTTLQNVAIDEVRVSAARDRGIREANSELLDTPSRVFPDPGVDLPLEGDADTAAIDGAVDPGVVNPADQDEIDPPLAQPVEPGLDVHDHLDGGDALGAGVNRGG